MDKKVVIRFFTLDRATDAEGNSKLTAEIPKTDSQPGVKYYHCCSSTSMPLALNNPQRLICY